MSVHRNALERSRDRANVLSVAARMFLEKGYEAVSVRQLAAAAGINVNTMVRDFGSKESILYGLVEYVMTGQFSAAKVMLSGATEDGVLYYAAETALQLHMAEHSEAVRNLYCAAYSLSDTSELILKSVTEKLTIPIFSAYLPGYLPSDFYQMEIATGSIVRGYMTVKCDETFPIDQKVDRFLEASLRVYRVPEEKIAQAKEFVKRFDYPTIAAKTIEDMLAMLQTTQSTHIPEEEET